MEDLLLKRWNSDIVTGDREASKPCLLGFNNTVQALEILRKHIDSNSRIAIHCDVDVDGIGSGYICKTFIKSQGATRCLYVINREKIHGIQEKHVDYFNNINKADLMIILDSSSNELEVIKKFNCDVIVVDHHEILHKDYYGVTNDGIHHYVIVNNMISNSNVNEIRYWLKNLGSEAFEEIQEYQVEERMSGAMVLYELLRVYCDAYKKGPLLENLMLYQWVGVTLFSDAILLSTDRNQWYIDNTVHSMYVQSCLQIMMAELNEYKATLDKSFINYTFSPIINKAIRAGASGEALDIVLNRPKDILQLIHYGELQTEALEKCSLNKIKYTGEYIIRDITSLGISRNYCGVVGSRLASENNKNAAIFIMHGDIADGSFRGRRGDVDYRKFFEDFDSSVFAQGHKAAFGFKLKLDLLKQIMSKLKSIEPENSKIYLTAGNVPLSMRGLYHIDNMNEFKKQGYYWRLATANSKLSSEEQLNIIGNKVDLKDDGQIGKVYNYEFMGIKCKAFEPITSNTICIYVELCKDIQAYVKNTNI